MRITSHTLKTLPEFYRLQIESAAMSEPVCSSEHDHQIALFDWAERNERKYPELRWMYAIPNGGHRSKKTAVELKREGVKSGVSDVHLPVSRGQYHGLYIEMKYGKNKMSENQKDFKTFAEEEGHFFKLAYTWQEAVSAVEYYLTSI